VISQNNGVINGYRNALYSGVTTMTMVTIINDVVSMNEELSGVWQVASQEISKYELVKQLIKVLNLNIELNEDHSFYCDRRLDGSKFTNVTGISVPSWDAMLSEFATDQIHYQ